jgi:epoxyqueuosine reductase
MSDAAPAAAALAEAVVAKGRALGFDAVGIAPATAAPGAGEDLRAYLSDGRHGEMAWMATTADRRADPSVLWPEARSIIVCGLNYGPATDPRLRQAAPDRGAISAYAHGRDYHDVMRRRLKAFGRWLAEATGAAAKVFVDTAPVMEKPLAQQAGLGWIGKHTNLVSRRFGSWLFLGEVFTTLPLPAAAAARDRCGSCRRCLDACPTGALPAPYRIEPRRCISYLTIEHQGGIPAALARRFANRIHGCDACLAVCPWNRFATATPHAELRPRPALDLPPLAALADLDDGAFRARFAGTAIRRTGHARFQRNVAIARANADGGGAG